MYSVQDLYISSVHLLLRQMMIIISSRVGLSDRFSDFLDWFLRVDFQSLFYWPGFLKRVQRDSSGLLLPSPLKTPTGPDEKSRLQDV